MTTRSLLKRAAVVCLGAILALLILGVAALPAPSSRRAGMPAARQADR